jgi:crotonobetainyl-CoA hydratase
MGPEMVRDLADAWTQFGEDEDAWVAILTGNGRAFCAGMDVKWRTETQGQGTGLVSDAERDPFWNKRVDKPVIAAVNGIAFGGGYVMAAHADLRLASESATFQYIEVMRGQYGRYEMQTEQTLGSGVAAEFALGGLLTAQRLYEAGFINRVVPPDQLMPVARSLADWLLSMPPLAVRYTVRLMHELRDARDTMPAQVKALAQEAVGVLRTSDDSAESFRAFIEKRQPVFRGR